MKYTLAYIISVVVILATNAAIVGGVYVGICHGDSPVTACEIGKE
jgi:hypothetical protein